MWPQSLLLRVYTQRVTEDDPTKTCATLGVAVHNPIQGKQQKHPQMHRQVSVESYNRTGLNCEKTKTDTHCQMNESNTAIGKKPATGGHTVCNLLPRNTSNGHTYRDTGVKTSPGQRRGRKWGAAVHAMCFTFVVAKCSRNRS